MPGSAAAARLVQGEAVAAAVVAAAASVAAVAVAAAAAAIAIIAARPNIACASKRSKPPPPPASPTKTQPVVEEFAQPLPQALQPQQIDADVAVVPSSASDVELHELQPLSLHPSPPVPFPEETPAEASTSEAVEKGELDEELSYGSYQPRKLRLLSSPRSSTSSKSPRSQPAVKLRRSKSPLKSPRSESPLKSPRLESPLKSPRFRSPLKSPRLSQSSLKSARSQSIKASQSKSQQRQQSPLRSPQAQSPLRSPVSFSSQKQNHGSIMRYKAVLFKRFLEGVQKLRTESETVSDITQLKDGGSSPKKTSKSAVNAPQVKLAEDGTLIIDETSLVITNENESDMWETVEEDRMNKKLSSLSFRKRPMYRGNPWNDLETDLFYDILRATGPDFGLMHEFFPSRTRVELKAKYNREERFNWDRLNQVLNYLSPAKPSVVAVALGGDILLGKVLSQKQKTFESNPNSFVCFVCMCSIQALAAPTLLSDALYKHAGEVINRIKDGEMKKREQKLKKNSPTSDAPAVTCLRQTCSSQMLHRVFMKHFQSSGCIHEAEAEEAILQLQEEAEEEPRRPSESGKRPRKEKAAAKKRMKEALLSEVAEEAEQVLRQKKDERKKVQVKKMCEKALKKLDKNFPKFSILVDEKADSITVESDANSQGLPIVRIPLGTTAKVLAADAQQPQRVFFECSARKGVTGQQYVMQHQMGPGQPSTGFLHLFENIRT
ncbi:unnamed protein product [Gongylonema pulchrum]|uniref:SANT domain-containing protein n=1 Tax=Gongylonema pulchrum TaxID=637853 RepID=A0A183DR00_9BILA|nr:unnamed protein product [Gongylonema pulchrum]